MKCFLILSILFLSLSASAQKEKEVKPRLDTLITGKVLFTDEKGIQYETFRSDNGYTSIIKNGKQIKLFRREPKRMPGAAEFAKSN